MATVERKRPAAVGAVRRVEAIQMRIAGHSQSAVAEKLGVTQQRVSAIEAEWLASRQPSVEVTEARRQQQLAGIDEVRSRLFAELDSEHVDHAAWLGVVDRISKLWEREAKLVGLDLAPGLQVHVMPSAEQVAVAYGWDKQAVIEGQAVEITEEAEA